MPATRHPFSMSDTRVEELQDTITTEVMRTLEAPPGSWRSRLYSAILRPAARRFARLGVEFDRAVESGGLPGASRTILPRFIRSYETRGAENVPAEGPLIVASNHPAAYDGLVILASMPRNDMKLVLSDVPFTRSMKATSRYLIYVSETEPASRARALLSMIHHLEDGGGLLIFPSGTVDPEISFMDGASQALGDWSNSLGIFLERVPQTRVVSTIVSGVLLPFFFRNPISQFPHSLKEKRKLAEMLQIASQLALGLKYPLQPKATFGQAQSIDPPIKDARQITSLLVEQARQVLAQHISQFYPGR